MSRSNFDKPFYVDVGTSIAAIRCASNHDVVCSIDHHGWKNSIELLEKDCDRMNQEAERFYVPTNVAAIEREHHFADGSKMGGNTAAMREAVEFVSHLDDVSYTSYDIAVAVQKAKAALSAPPRNCDVGTSDEQSERFENFCLKHIGCAEETGGRHCGGCPLEKASRNITQKCELYWAQMPYEEGGKE